MVSQRYRYLLRMDVKGSRGGVRCGKYDGIGVGCDYLDVLSSDLSGGIAFC